MKKKMRMLRVKKIAKVGTHLGLMKTEMKMGMKMRRKMWRRRGRYSSPIQMSSKVQCGE